MELCDKGELKSMLDSTELSELVSLITFFGKLTYFSVVSFVIKI